MDVETILEQRIEDRNERQWILSHHANARAQTRLISISEIKSVLAYGTKGPADKGACEYKFAGVIAMVDHLETIVLTVYPEPGYGIDLDMFEVTNQDHCQHTLNCRRLKMNKGCWTSHTVAVIDQSGSMRATDIDKGVTRSALVWVTLALDFVRHSLESGERTWTDVLSVVLMKDEASIIIQCEPIDWILYNRLVKTMRTEKPSSGGNYIPALDAAEGLLHYNSSRRCALSLLFLSDGVPSDKMRRGEATGGDYANWLACMKSNMSWRVGELVKWFGKRLNLCFYAIGPEESNDFSIMKYMADQAKEYECPVVYQPASLKAGDLSTALRTMSAITTATISTISEVPKGEEYRDYEKMKQSDVGSPILTDTWEVILQEERGFRKRRITKTSWDAKKGGWRPGYPVFASQEAIGLAWERRWFGQGSERLAKELREVGRDGKTFVGPPMVLKASITVSKSVDVDSKDFHKRFCKSQFKAQQFSSRFNDAVARLSINVSKIEFIPCWVYMVELGRGDRKGYLIEPALDVSSYKKFNDNQGKVFESPAHHHEGSRPLTSFRSLSLAPIFEGAAGESDDETEQDETLGEDVPVDVLQAFSCWTFKVASKRRYLVCDLQGTFVPSWEGGPGTFRLTDPVIHTSDLAREEINRKYGRHEITGGNEKRFGRTDRGQLGIDDFYRTHQCSDLCRKLASRSFRTPGQGVPHRLVGSSIVTSIPSSQDIPCGE